MNKRVFVAGLAAGAVLNVVGWLGNQLVLGRMWKDTIQTVVPLRSRTWVNEVVSLLPDFVYGVALAWLFALLVQAGASRSQAVLKASAWVCAVGAMTTVLGIWNSGFIPPELAISTTLLAMLTFVPAGWLVSRMLPPSSQIS